MLLWFTGTRRKQNNQTTTFPCHSHNHDCRASTKQCLKSESAWPGNFLIIHGPAIGFRSREDSVICELLSPCPVSPASYSIISPILTSASGMMVAHMARTTVSQSIYLFWWIIELVSHHKNANSVLTSIDFCVIYLNLISSLILHTNFSRLSWSTFLNDQSYPGSCFNALNL